MTTASSNESESNLTGRTIVTLTHKIYQTIEVARLSAHKIIAVYLKNIICIYVLGEYVTVFFLFTYYESVIIYKLLTINLHLSDLYGIIYGIK